MLGYSYVAYLRKDLVIDLHGPGRAGTGAGCIILAAWRGAAAAVAQGNGRGGGTGRGRIVGDE